MEIYDTNDSFNFEKLVLTKPSLLSGGNYLIKCLVNNEPLYIQPPKCKTKQGFSKVGKRFSCDLMFTNENENFIRWMENLENHCQQFIYKNKDKWFDGEMELHDIENYFTSPLKLYKSGKYYIARININTILNKPTTKIYDENENEIDMESISEDANVVTILEIQGIKCSSRSFQIEIELKQMMVLQPSNIFEKCIIKSSTNTTGDIGVIGTNNLVSETNDLGETKDIVGETKDIVGETKDLGETNDLVGETNDLVGETKDIVGETNEHIKDIGSCGNDIFVNTSTINIQNIQDGIEEIDFNLEELKEDESFQIKKRDDVYYEMYREARKKAKKARDLALSSYLEAKRIKNTYMLDDIDDSDSDNSNLEMSEDDENSINNE